MPIVRPAVLTALAILLASFSAAPGSSSAEPGDPTAGMATEAATSTLGAEPAGCPHAGNGPCCTSCREKQEQAAATGDKPAVADEPGGCPCRRARKLAGGS